MTQEISALAAAVEAKALERVQTMTRGLWTSIARLIVLGVAAGVVVAAMLGAVAVVMVR